MKSRYGLSKVGDDCAVLPKDHETDLLISSDMLVEEIDFRLAWATPEQIGHKALAVSLSDIAAMGGTPTYAMLSMALVENLWKADFLDRFYQGWHDLARNFGVELIGGDVSRTEGPLVIDSTVLGEVPKGRAILRSGAKPGEAIFVTGTLGRAAGGLRSIEGGRQKVGEEAAFLIAGVLTPAPQISMGKSLEEQGLATSMIDLSDGLSSDLQHLCDQGRTGAEVNVDLIPVEPALAALFSPDECVELALNGGEDFQLLFTGDAPTIEAAHLVHVTRIGTVTARPGFIELVSGVGRETLRPRGYRHF